MSRMLVLHFLPDERVGGPQRRILTVGRVLSAAGVRTEIATRSRCRELAELASRSGIGVHPMALTRIASPRRPLAFTHWAVRVPLDILRFAAVVRKVRPDVVHVNGPYSIVGALAARREGVELCWHLNDMTLPPAMAAILRPLYRRIASEIIVSSDAVRAHFGLSKDEVTVVPPPVDKLDFSPTIGPNAAGGACFHIALIGNVNPLKGIDAFLRVVALLRDRYGSRLRASVAGAMLRTQKEYMESLQRLVGSLGLADTLTFRDFVADIPAFLTSVDVLVVTSRSEAGPMVVLEAMAAATPVVAFDVGGVRQFLAGGTRAAAGTVVEGRDEERMASAIDEILRSPALAARMGREGRRRVESHFDVRRIAAIQLEVYSRAMMGGDHRQRPVEEERL